MDGKQVLSASKKFQEGSLDFRYPHLVSGFRGEVHLSIFRLGRHCLKALPETPDHPTGKKGTLASAVYFHPQTS